MEIRRAMPVIKTERPAEARRFYEGYLGFRVAMDEDGMLMLASPSTPTTQVIIAWSSETAVDPELMLVDVSIEVADVEGAYPSNEREGEVAAQRAVGKLWMKSKECASSAGHGEAVIVGTRYSAGVLEPEECHADGSRSRKRFRLSG